MDFDQVKVIDSEIKNKQRKVVEAFQMRKKKRMLKRQGGFNLLWIYMQLRGGDGRCTTYPSTPSMTSLLPPHRTFDLRGGDGKYSTHPTLPA